MTDDFRLCIVNLPHLKKFEKITIVATATMKILEL